MDGLRRFGAIVRADFRERSRSTRFWVVLAGVAVFTWSFFPPADAGYVTVAVGSSRGLYSSAWIGMVLGLMYSSMLALFGFYIVRGTVTRDFETRVWQLLVATPMTRPAYLLAKWTSHMAVFLLIVAAGLAVGLAAQWHLGESTSFSLWQLVQPSLVFALPALALAAFFAILFDLLPWLRRSGGNVLYFFVWIFVFISFSENLDPEKSAWAASTWISEPGGLAMAIRDIKRELAMAMPDLDTTGFSIGASVMSEGQGVSTFVWESWTPAGRDLFGRFLWLAVALAGVVALSPMLDWAAARSEASQPGQRSTPGFRLAWMDLLLRPLERVAAGRLFAAELKLVLRQRRLVWWLAVTVLLVIQGVAPDKGQAVAVILAWLSCLDVFARAALRERETATSALVFSASGAARRVLGARLAVALTLAVGLALPALLRSDAPTVLALVLTAATVAVSGLALATACRNPRPYELAMVFLAYIGVQDHPILNPFADAAASLAWQAWLLPAALALLAIAWPLSVRRH